MKKFGHKFPFDYQYACLKKGLSLLTITLLIILTSTLNLFARGTSSLTEKVSFNMDQPSAGIEMQQEKKITGTVTDAKGQPLTGVTVTAKGTTSGTLTDLKGKYELNVPGRAETLVFSFVGMKSQEAGIGNRNVVDVALQEELIQIDEVVVIGYGTQKREDLSAAIAVVPDVEKLKSIPVLSTESILQGIIPGVTVVNQGGQPNVAPTVTIRGIGSKSESVLYVVDGVPNAPYNAEDVESITILKDAASAAIYGAYSGSAGVILITTKQAKEGKTSVQYSGFFGVKQAWRELQSCTSEQLFQVYNQAYTNSGLTVPDGWNPAINTNDYVTRTNWMNETFRVAQVQRHTLTINSGTDKMKSLFEARYENEDGTLINTFNNNISLRYNALYKFNKYVNLKQDIFWNNNSNRGTDTESGYSGAVLSALYMPRSATVYYDDGTFGGTGPRDSQYLGIHGDAINPVATLLRNQAYNKSSDLNSISELRITELMKGLEITSRFSYRAKNTFYKSFSPMQTEPGKPNAQNSLSYSTSKSFGWIWENTINYNRVFDRHNVGVMLASSAREDGSRNFGAGARDFSREDGWARFFVNATTFTSDIPTDGQWDDKNMSYVGRLSYSFADRYFVTGSYRRDIAGRLAKGNRMKDFPGVTAAWKLSSEPWFEVAGIDLVKIRASWGRIGNIGSVGRNYGYPVYSASYTYQVGNGSPRSNDAYIASAFYADLSWETSEQTDIGLDLAFLNKRLNISSDYFKKRTFDLIKRQDTGWPNAFGVTAPFINKGEITNRGVEFIASWNDVAGAFSYGLSGNFSALKNEVTFIDENPAIYWAHTDAWRTSALVPFRSVVGQPYYSYWLIQNAGIFQTQDEVDSYTYTNPTTGAVTKIQPNAKAGDLKFIDQDGNGSIGDGDRVFMGSAFPKMTYGFSGNLGWKNWEFNVFFQGVGGVKLFNAFKEATLNAAEQGYNRWNKILDAWSPTNTGSNIPIIKSTDPNKNFGTCSDWYLENGNYMRLKNLLIGYTFKDLPWDIKLRIYFSGENLLTFTKYSGFDPEVGGVGLDGGKYPVSRIYSFGANINF